MPKTSFEFEVSTDKPKAIVDGPDYLAKPIASLFRQKGLSVQTSLTGQPTEPVDYIVDAEGNKNLINFAVETGAKYLRLVVDEEPQNYQENINWRIIQTSFVVGPSLPETTLMGRLIQSAIKNSKLIMPPSDQKLYPIHVNDLAEACWQSLIVPNTSKKQFLVLGDEVSSQRLGAYLENLGQTTNGIENSPSLSIKKYNPDQIEISKQALNWKIKFNWQEAVKKSFQSMWGNPPQVSQAGGQGPTKTPQQSDTASHLDRQEVGEAEEKETVEKQDITEIIDEEMVEKDGEGENNEEEVDDEVIVIEEPVDKDQEVREAASHLDWQGLEEVQKVDEIAEEFEKKPIDEKETSFAWWHPLILILFLGTSFFISVWLKPTLRLALGGWQMNKAYTEIMAQNWQTGLDESEKAKDNFLLAEQFLENSNLAELFFGYQKLFARGAELGRKTALAAETAIPFFKSSLELSESILKNKTYDQKNGISQLNKHQKNLDHQLTEIQALLEGSWPHIPGRWEKTPQKMAGKIDQAHQDLTKIDNVLPHLPWIIGLDNQRRTFLVLLQNNMELRPTGGFIGSYAILTFENGQLLDFQVEDVYTADGQLKGHVEPPTQIKEILGEAKWYLRDSNWNPNFPDSAENAEWFLEKELNRQVDGVVGFNLEAAKKLISAFGEIYLADFNEKISADNVFERAEFWSENESFPGSNQKSAFLGLMGQQLFENIKAAQPEEYTKIGQKFLEALREKEIIAYTHNDQLNLTLKELNWDGSMRSPQCSLNNCFTDYIHINEANLGVNKSNYFLRRSIEEGITISDSGAIDHQLKINYENTAGSKNWPGGDYKAYVRIYLPAGTEVSQIAVYNSQNSGNKEIIRAEDRDEKIEFGRQVVGFELKVPIQERKTLEVNFSQTTNLSGENFGYLLYWQKQSGYRNTPISLLVDFPDNWQPLQVNPAANVVSGKLLFNQQLNKDLNFGIQFSK